MIENQDFFLPPKKSLEFIGWNNEKGHIGYHIVTSNTKKGNIWMAVPEEIDIGELFRLEPFSEREGYCFGHRDFGEYFKDPEIKRKWEAREEIKSKGRRLQVGDFTSGIGAGVSIYNMSDLIEVDCEQGILFCSRLLKNLVPDYDKP